MLEKHDAARNFVNLSDAPLTECATVGRKVQFSSVPTNGFFYKVIRFDLFNEEPSAGQPPLTRAQHWRRLYRVYNRYAEISGGTDMKRKAELPPALSPARLLFGEFQVAVQMPFLVGAADCGDLDDLTKDQHDAVVLALVFLLQNGLIYTDLRAPNVMTHGEEVHLVDFDDMYLLEDEPPAAAASRMQRAGAAGAAVWASVLQRLA